METYYKIAEIVMKIDCPFTLVMNGGQDFQCKPVKPDYIFRFQQIESVTKILEDADKVAELEWADDYQLPSGELARAFVWRKNQYAAVTICGEREGTCYYVGREFLQYLNRRGVDLTMYLCMERILLSFNCLVLHSSHIEVDGQGVVFSAPSQTGKSTQAELWRKYAGATVMNGDRSVLRKVGDIWNVYGCPMCGSSGIHLQGNEPLKHIVMLSQGKKNEVKRVNIREAVRLIYPQITITSWDVNYVQRALDLISNVILEVPIWYFTCTKSVEAVKTLQNVLNFPGGSR